MRPEEPAPPRAATVGTVLASRSAWISRLIVPRTRALVRGRRERLLVAGIATAYLAIALFVGGMVDLVPTGERGVTFVLLTNLHSPAWWNYPALLILTPGGLAIFPLAPTLAMGGVAVGVGLGMGSGVALARRVVRDRDADRTGRDGARSSFAMMTPAMLAVLVLGACCSTGAAAAGTIGLLSGSTAGSYTEILTTSGALDLLQLGVLYLALLAQEHIIMVYAGLGEGAKGTGATDDARNTRSRASA